ncbi:ricin B lectin domain-containing protein [Radiomyces spectabilis]|uniref:ricin B lectin domain-containing protein n=1 Tax=Radiomyces spectabilis TaxID=64574 RepID=UPI00221F08AB|nr:ricin B lectin domain-containing protein [Radiomyces spectabilis]KAI8372897.1 ricin B lectin domain-containing protein [Radiomyces spectabilis]
MVGFPENTYFYIRSRQNGSCLDVYNGETSADTSIIIWPKKENDNDNQLWRFEDGFLINKKSNLVMDVRGGDLKSDKPVVQYDRKLTQAHNQRWGYRDGFIYVLADPRLVLDIKGGKDKDGTKVILYLRKDTENDNQQWTIEPFGTPGYQQQPAPQQQQQQQSQWGAYGPPPGYEQQRQSSGGLAGYGPPDDENPAYSSYSTSSYTTSSYSSNDCAPISYEQASEAHREVYQERKAHLSHQLIAGAAAYEAVKAYRRRQEAQGKPVSYGFAKQAVAAFAAAEVVKFAETHNWSHSQKEAAQRSAEQAADHYASREFGGY